MSRSSGVKGFFPCCCLLECFTLHQRGEKEHPWYLLPVAYIWVSRK